MLYKYTCIKKGREGKRKQSKCIKMLTFRESGGRVCKYFYFCDFHLSLQLLQKFKKDNKGK